jgi:hypothetical protein
MTLESLDKTSRMRTIYEREKKLRLSAKFVVRHGEPLARTTSPNTYVESATAAALRRVFEEDENPWW